MDLIKKWGIPPGTYLLRVRGLQLAHQFKRLVLENFVVRRMSHTNWLEEFRSDGKLIHIERPLTWHQIRFQL